VLLRLNVSGCLLSVHSLEVHLSKLESSHWPELLPGDTRGTQIFTTEQLSVISDRLEKFTSDKVHISSQIKSNFTVAL